MKQKLLLLLTALLASASMWAKVGDTFTRSGVKYEVKTDYPGDPTAWVVGHESWLYGDVAILDNINGYDVTGIKAFAFSECTDLKSVIIPEGVTYIGQDAFSSCSGLKSVSIPGSVETIEYCAFEHCTALTSIAIPEGVTAILPFAFHDCTSLISVTIPSTVTVVGLAAFCDCTSVEDVYCYADPSNMEWGIDLQGEQAPQNVYSEFKDDGTTKFHVKSGQLYKFEAKWSTGDPEKDIRVTFVGDLNSPVLTDSEPYTRTVEKTVSMATYKKTLGSDRVGKHQAWLLPFDYEVKAADLVKFSFYKINMIANSPSPDTETSEDAWVFLTKMEAGDKLKANMPYVYKPLAAVTDYQFITTNTPMKAPESSELAKTETMTHVYSFFATYLPTSPSSGFDFYYVNDEGSVSYGEDDDGVTVSPYRWIVRTTSKTGGSTAYAREMHFVDGEGEVTGIDAPLNDNGEMINDSWYTIDGVKLQGEPRKKGIYIVKGKKVVK